MVDKILVVSSYTFQNMTLTHVIENEMSLSCELTMFKNISYCDESFSYNNGSYLLLWDFLGNNMDKLWDMLTKSAVNNNNGKIVGLYNVQNNTEMEKKFLELGARGVFYEDCSLDHFKKGIQALINGELWFSRKILNEYILENFNNNFQSYQYHPVRTSLTRREKEILMMIASGKTNQEIADECFISPSTVKTHIYNIFQKINVPNRIQAALWTVKHLGVNSKNPDRDNTMYTN